MIPTENHDRGQQLLLRTLEQLLELPAVDLPTAMGQAAQLIVKALKADKVDAFLFDPSRQALRALGTSDTPVGRQELAQGLDYLSLANGGRIVRTYESGQPILVKHMDQDEDELPGMVSVLGLRSQIAVPIEVAGERRGVIAAQSQTPAYFQESDLVFLKAAARWVGALAHRAELVEASTAVAKQSGRRQAADELILVLAHDLRNYLGPLKGRLEIVRLRAEQDARLADLEDVERAGRALDRLANMVHDLLDVGRLEQGLFVLARQPIDLMMLAPEIAQGLSTSDVEVLVSGPEQLRLSADPNRIRQILENLIGNAVKHSPKGKAVLVKLRRELRADLNQEQAIVEVIDRGPGVPKEILPRIFERFAQAGAEHGLGLGLYLAHRIAVAHGGALAVRSVAHQGASFQLTLPIAPLPEHRI